MGIFHMFVPRWLLFFDGLIYVLCFLSSIPFFLPFFFSFFLAFILFFFMLLSRLSIVLFSSFLFVYFSPLTFPKPSVPPSSLSFIHSITISYFVSFSSDLKQLTLIIGNVRLPRNLGLNKIFILNILE